MGEPPFYSDDIPTIYKNIKNGKLTFPSNLSSDIKNLIKRLLEKNPKNRIGAQNKAEIKQHPFFNGFDWAKCLRKEMQPPITNFGVKDDDDDLSDEEEIFGYEK